KAERKDGGTLETLAHHVGMLQQGLLSNFGGRDVFADDDRKLPPGEGSGLRLAYTLAVLYADGTAASNTTLERPLLNDPVRVPCHRMLLLSEKLVGRL